MIRKIALTVGAAVITVTGLTGTADAKASYGPDFCDYTGITNTFGSYDEPLVIDFMHLRENEFDEFYCVREGFRLYKAVANTRSEVKVLRTVADKNGTKDTPVLFCKSSAKRARMIDLAQAWAVRGIDEINLHEAFDYKPWLKRFTKRHPDCHVYR